MAPNFDTSNDISHLNSTQDKSSPRPAYYAIIPADVRYNKNLEAHAKLLYGEITALCNQQGYCWASNKYFAELYDVDERTIQRWLKSLKDNSFIFVKVDANSFNSSRKIYIIHPGQNIVTERQNCHTHTTNMSPPHDKNVVHNSTSNNTEKHVVVGEEPLPPPVFEKQSITKSDVYHYSMGAKTDWSSEEIESAWIAFSQSKAEHTDPYAYIAGIIKKKRVLHANKQQQESKTCPKTQKTKKDRYSPSSETSSNNKNEYLSQDTQVPSLAKYGLITPTKTGWLSS